MHNDVRYLHLAAAMFVEVQTVAPIDSRHRNGETDFNQYMNS